MRPRTLSTILALAPAITLACGDCTDQLLESHQWWIWLVPFLVLGLIAEGALFTVVTWARRIETVSPRAYPTAIAGGLFTLLLFGGGGMILGLSAAALVLVVAAGWSLKRNDRFSHRLTWLRVAVVVAGAAVGVWQAWPSHRALSSLLHTAVTTTRFRGEEGWVIEELRKRPDAVPELERLALEGSADEALLRLHESLGGAASFRGSACTRWRTSEHMGINFDELCPQP